MLLPRLGNPKKKNEKTRRAGAAQPETHAQAVALFLTYRDLEGKDVGRMRERIVYFCRAFAKTSDGIFSHYLSTGTHPLAPLRIMLGVMRQGAIRKVLKGNGMVWSGYQGLQLDRGHLHESPILKANRHV